MIKQGKETILHTIAQNYRFTMGFIIARLPSPGEMKKKKKNMIKIKICRFTQNFCSQKPVFIGL